MTFSASTSSLPSQRSPRAHRCAGVAKQRRRISRHPGASTCITQHRSCQNAPRQNHSSLKNLLWSFQSNQQYSVVAVTDSSGAVVERHAYSAYGTPTITNGSGSTIATSAIANRYTYTGREWDGAIALYHYRARMYDSAGGRFVSRDPASYADGPQVYSLVSGRPATRIDPTGKLSVNPSTGPGLGSGSSDLLLYPNILRLDVSIYAPCRAALKRWMFPVRRCYSGSNELRENAREPLDHTYSNSLTVSKLAIKSVHTCSFFSH